MATITIDGTDFAAYATVAGADAYMAAAAHGAAWRSASEEDKARALVTATRVLDRQRWKGDDADPADGLAWPRTGVAGVADDAIPQAIVDACCELALVILEGGEVQTAGTTEERIKRLKAGSVEIENFRGAGSDPTRFPLIVQELIGKWLAGSGGLGGVFASGVSKTTDPIDYGFTRPL